MSRKRKAETQLIPPVVLPDCPGECMPNTIDAVMQQVALIVPSIVRDLRNIIEMYLECSHQLAFSVPTNVRLGFPFIDGLRGLAVVANRKTRELSVYTGPINTDQSMHWTCRVTCLIAEDKKTADVQFQSLIQLARHSDFVFAVASEEDWGYYLDLAHMVFDNFIGVIDIPGLLCFGDVTTNTWSHAGKAGWNTSLVSLADRWTKERNPEVYIDFGSLKGKCLWELNTDATDWFANINGRSNTSSEWQYGVSSNYTILRITRRLMCATSEEWFHMYNLPFHQIQSLASSVARDLSDCNKIHYAQIIAADKLILRNAMHSAVPDISIDCIDSYLY